ncbi:MAG: hypothetical protein ACHQ53_04855 [Polyangiales bacterium]
MRWLHAALFALVCGSAPLAFAPAASAQEADGGAYRQTIDDAVREFAAGHFEEARALFKRAHELSPNARTLRGMGMAAFELRMYVSAIRELDAALNDTRKPLDGDLRTQVQQLMAKAREFVGRVTLVLQPPEAKVLVDGKDPQLEPDGSILLDVGTHVVSANADGYKPSNLRFNVEGDSEQTVRVALEPLLAMQAGVAPIDTSRPLEPVTKPAAPAESTKPAAPPVSNGHLATYGWIALAGAGAFGIASGVFWLVGNGQYKDLKDPKTGCAPNCTNQQIDASGVKTSDLLTNVFLGVAAASAVTGGVLLAIDAASSSGERASATRDGRADRASLAVQAGPTSFELRGTF